MSDLLNQASLVMVPSGYKEDTVYSVVPTDGSGDLTFTRASNGTRINSAGLVEVCPWNLVQYSEDFSNGYWSKDVGATVDSNVATAPNGTTTADRLNFSGSGQAVYTIQSFSGANTFSVYLKGEGANIGKQIYLEVGVTATVTLTGEWQRFEVNADNAASVAIKRNTSGQASAVLAWGIQVNGGALKPYFPTTDRLNVPRLTYQNGGGGCPSLLLEKQSTNLLEYSEQIQNTSYWNVIGGDLVVTGNATTSPDGTQNAGSITLANSANRYFVHSSISITGGTAYTYSVWMKSASGNLSVNMGGVNGLSGVIKTVTTEWQRFTYTFTQPSTYTEYFGFDQRGGGASTSGTLYFWGAQVEASSYATSYIGTTSSSATRVADACYKTGISSLFGTNQGTLFVDIANAIELDFPQVTADDNSNTNRIVLYREATNGYWGVFLSAGGTTSNFSSTVSSTGGKFAIAYNSSGFLLYKDGAQILSFSNTVPSSLSAIRFNGRATNDFYTNKNIKEAILFPTKLTATELASLTA